MTVASQNIMQEWKEKTAPLHQEIEKHSFSEEIMNGTLTPSQYSTLIIKNYLFHLDAEKKICDALPPDIMRLTRFADRIKIPFLLQDLNALGLRPNGYEFVSKLEVPDEWTALGCMYVLEGSTLGGAMIRKQLLKNNHFK